MKSIDYDNNKHNSNNNYDKNKNDNNSNNNDNSSNNNDVLVSNDNNNLYDQSRKDMTNYHNYDNNNDVGAVVDGDDDDLNNNNMKYQSNIKKLLKDNNISCIKLSVTEGKYRMVRRILHNCGYSVLHLHRLSYGSIILDENVIHEGKVGQVHIYQQEIILDLYNKYNIKNKKK